MLVIRNCEKSRIDESWGIAIQLFTLLWSIIALIIIYYYYKKICKAPVTMKKDTIYETK